MLVHHTDGNTKYTLLFSTVVLNRMRIIKYWLQIKTPERTALVSRSSGQTVRVNVSNCWPVYFCRISVLPVTTEGIRLNILDIFCSLFPAYIRVYILDIYKHSSQLL